MRQLTERLIALHPIDELIHVIARRELQLSDQLPIGRMLNDDVDDLRSLIHDRIKLLTHLLRCVQDSDLSFAAGIGARINAMSPTMICRDTCNFLANADAETGVSLVRIASMIAALRSICTRLLLLFHYNRKCRCAHPFMHSVSTMLKAIHGPKGSRVCRVTRFRISRMPAWPPAAITPS